MEKLEEIKSFIKRSVHFTNFSGYTDPREVDWDELIQISKYQKSKRHGFTLNQETLGLDFEKFKPTIISREEWYNKPIGKVCEEVIKEYSDTHYIPGFEYQKWLRQNPDKVPSFLEDGKRYYTPGTVFTHCSGRVDIPFGWYYEGYRWQCCFSGDSVEWPFGSNGGIILLPRKKDILLKEAIKLCEENGFTVSRPL